MTSRVVTEHHVNLLEVEFFDAVPTVWNDGFPEGRPVQVRSLYFCAWRDELRVQIPSAVRRLRDGGLSIRHWPGGDIPASSIPEQMRAALLVEQPDLKRWFR